MAPASLPVSPPRLTRAMTERSPSQKAKLSEAEASTSKLTVSEATDGSASSTTARRDHSARVRTRSVSSHAVPVSHLAFLNTQAAQHVDRGPGTPDFTLASSAPLWRKSENERVKAMPSLGQGLQLISEQSSQSIPRRPRSSSDASSSSTSSSSSPKKKANASALSIRPRLSHLRSFLSSFGGSETRPLELSSQDVDSDEVTVLPTRPQPLLMPSARTAGINSFRGLNEDSPPLTPISDPEDQSEYQQYLRAFQNQTLSLPIANKYHGAPKHQWSAAQAAADAAHPDDRQTTSPPPASPWHYTPPLSSSSGTASSVSARAFSPPAWLDATNVSAWLPGNLSSQITSAMGGSRPPTPASTATSSSLPSGRTYNAFDGDAYRVDSISKSLSAFLPRVQINLSSWRISMPNIRPFLPQLLALLLIFAAATGCVVMMLSTLPLVLPKHIAGLTLTEIKEVALSLKTYSDSSNKAFIHTLVVIGTFFTWKQSFTVPGSLIMNVVFGAMYGTYWGTLYTSVLTSVGGVFCYLLSAPLGPLITSMPGLAKPLDAMRRALSPAREHGRSAGHSTSGNDGNVWTYLLVLRVLPIVPYGLMNIACGVLRVPLVPYAATLAVGSIPWNFVTVQVGDLLQEIVEALPAENDMSISTLTNKAAGGPPGGGMKVIVDHIWNRRMMVKLVLLSIASLAPMILSRYLKRRQQQQAQRDEGYEQVITTDDRSHEPSSDEEDRPGSQRASRLFTHSDHSVDGRCYEMDSRRDTNDTRRLTPAWL